MKRRLLPLALLSLLLGACDTPAPAASTSDTPTPVASTSGTPSSGPSVTPTPSETPGVISNATCDELSFYLDPAIGSGYTCETVPESTDEIEPWPQHTLVTLEDYPLLGTFFTAHIAVYPVADYTALRPEVPLLMTDLQALTSGGPTPVYLGPLASPLPFLPVFNAGQVFPAQYQVLPFASGDGIRYLTQISMWSPPVNNTDLFYTFQGLTDDGQYWISATLPINLPYLPAAAEPLPGGVTFEEWADNFMPYITDMIDQLNAESPDSFTPSIDDLDALVSSITIGP
jgi:hypothetical protein